MNEGRIVLRPTLSPRDNEAQGSSELLIKPEMLQYFMYDQTEVRVVNKNELKDKAWPSELVINY